MERVIVTGCCGFVGRFLTDFLREEGYEVWGSDRGDVCEHFTGKRYLLADMRYPMEVTRVLDEVHPDFIVHLAAQSSAHRSFQEPYPTFHNNVMSVLHILEYMRVRNSNTRLLAVGSADIYGAVEAKDLPLTEDHHAAPGNPYALSKLVQEQCCLLYAALYNLDVVMTRSFHHTGPGRPDTFVLSSFARQVVEIGRGRRNHVIEVGNIDVCRDFSDVRDVVRAYALLLKKGRKGEVYNVCSGVAYKLEALLKKMFAIAGVHPEIRVDPSRLRPTDILEIRGDRSKISRETGWEPKYAINETLVALMDYWSDRIAA
jgi:GDP-4-dehydro-6-deoxy-D-mannose reductase